MKLFIENQIALSLVAIFSLSGCPDDGTGVAPRGKDNPPAMGTLLDRTGRPAINTAVNNAFEGDPNTKNARKDAYNTAEPAAWNGFLADFKTALAILDALDATCGNQLGAGADGTRYDTLATALLDDRLYLNAEPSGADACPGNTYLGVEAEALGVLPAGDGKCGGRTPRDDVIETSYSVLAAGALAGIDDTITSDGKLHSLSNFPFLAGPN